MHRAQNQRQRHLPDRIITTEGSSITHPIPPAGTKRASIFSVHLLTIQMMFLLLTAAVVPYHAGAQAASPAPAGTQEAAYTLPASAAGTGLEERYRLDPQGTLFAFRKDQNTWVELNRNLPVKVAYPFTEDLRDPVFSFATDPSDPSRLAVATPRGIYVSPDAGTSWEILPTERGISQNIHFTSVAVSPHRESTYLAGTSFDGLYETTDGGRSWKHVTETANFLYQGSGFYEEMRAAAYDPANPGVIYITAGFGEGLYRHDRSDGSWDKLELPAERNAGDIRHAQFWKHRYKDSSQPEWALQIRMKDAILLYFPASGSWSERSLPADGMVSAGSAAKPESSTKTGKARRLALVGDKNGIYVNAAQASGAHLDRHIKFIKDHGMNSLVVDFKDDFGYLRYHSELPLARAAGSIRPLFRAEELVRKAHEAGLHLIGRIVVFKDERLYRYDNFRYALRDRYTDRPWGNILSRTDPETGEEKKVQLEFWVDPYSEDIWDYNIGIAEELQKLGVDEVQFDYIRFPSDGDVSRILPRYRREGMTRVNALESFLAKARDKLSIPIGTDVYGFNAWYRMKYIGQDIEVFSRYVDVISPMFYPSHFPRDFLQDLRYLPRSRQIYQEGTRRAVEISRGDCVIRPYVQAFLIGGELKFEKPTYTSYLTHQLEGVRESTGSGFTLWNASGRYYMVTPSVQDFTTNRKHLD